MYYPTYQSTGILKVCGFEGAKQFPVAPNSMVPLFDMNEDIFYVKQSDAGGFATITPYSFKKIEEPAPKPTGDFVTRQEFEELKGMLAEYGKHTISEASATAKQSDADASAIQSVSSNTKRAKS